MPFQVNNSVYYPIGAAGKSELANHNAWKTISESKIIERLEDNKLENPEDKTSEMKADTDCIVKIKNVWYRYIDK